MQLDAVVLLIFALATARATGIVTGADELTRPYVKVKFVDWVNPDDLETGWRHAIAYLATCQWCASIWLGLFVFAPLAHWHGSNPIVYLFALGLAFSQVTGMLSRLGRD